MSADLLLLAAELLRGRAIHASQGAWSADPDAKEVPHMRGAEGSAGVRVEGWQFEEPLIWRGVLSKDDAEYVAMMHPPVALALADLLTVFTMMPSASDPTDLSVAYALARAILREPDRGQS